MISFYSKSKRPTSHVKTRWRWHRRGTLFVLAFSLSLLTANMLAPQSLDYVRHHLMSTWGSVVGFAMQPVWYVRHLLHNIEIVTQLRTFLDNYHSLEKQVGDLKQQLFQVQWENRSLRQLLKAPANAHELIATAPVLFAPNNLHHHTLLIQAGTAQGIRHNMAITNQYGVVGRVIDTASDTARILLMTDSNSRIPVWIATSHQHGMVVGQNNGRPVLAYLAQPELIKLGDVVVTSGYEGVFPAGLPVGTVEKITNGTIHIRPFANLSRLEFVQVVGSKGETSPTP